MGEAALLPFYQWGNQGLGRLITCSWSQRKGQRLSSQEYKSIISFLCLKTFQWLPCSLRVKTKVLIMVCNALGGLTLANALTSSSSNIPRPQPHTPTCVHTLYFHLSGCLQGLEHSSKLYVRALALALSSAWTLLR